jgi:hypothetical protein
MADKKYIEAWNDVPEHFCPHLPLIEEALTEDSNNPGPHAAVSDSLRRQAVNHLKENPCTFVKTGECALSKFLTRKALEIKI